MKSSEIRNKFLCYFEGKGHKILPGSSLVPSDPTVLLTLAGMLQFKPIFLGQEKPPQKRATTVQKCMRMNDLQNVGKTPRHHTFFEMLGNFSFGDYFKKEAIQFAWELLVKEFKLPVAKLKIAVFEKDDEAFDIWKNNIGLPKEIIHRLGEENNFWSAGPTGPCGPCSEIYFDTGEEHGCGKPGCNPGCDCDRFLEIWNLVFIQYDRNDKGELISLKQKGIDTGMGLERIASILQGVSDNFETDLFIPIIKKLKSFSKTEEMSKASLHIIADHIRSITNLISDGVYPGNGGRNYVLRRLIRRAITHGRRLGIVRPFLHELSGEVVFLMGETYPQLIQQKDSIAQIIKEEEENFIETLEHGLRLFEEIVGRHQEDKLISGSDAFKLHDTFGFPIELTAELSEEKGCKVDISGFEKEMESQRERARKTGIDSDKKKLLTEINLSHLKATSFTGYEKSIEEAKIEAFFPDKKLIVLDKTPFFGESGGQVGDTGIFLYNNKEIRVTNTFITPQKTILHEVEHLEGLKDKAKVQAKIDVSKRKATEAHHSATHLLHKALREVLGEHVKQAGSYVGPDKLRLDFSHFHCLSLDEIQKIELIVNQKIAEQLKVEVLQKAYADAVKMGAMALFNEKYGDQVRVLKIGNYSLELCGGTHVKNTSEIQFFKIISESALGSGVRRIEAVAGQAAKVHVIFKAKSLYDEVGVLINKYHSLQTEKEHLGGSKFVETNIFEIDVTELDSLAKAVDNHDAVGVNKFLDHLYGRVDWLKERIGKAEKEIEILKIKDTQNMAVGVAAEAVDVQGNKILLKEVKAYSMDRLRILADSLQNTLKSYVLLLASSFPDKLLYLAVVSPELVEQGISAKKIAETFTGIVGGKGGGKDTKFEGGGKEPAKIQSGFEAVRKLLLK